MRSLVTLAMLVTAAAAYAQGPSLVAVAGQPTLSFGAYDLVPLGYTTAEFFISGNASSYTLASTPTEDGRWDAMPAESAPFVTRIVVARPADPRKFSGTIVVEWLNVTGGTDAAVDWNAAHREMIRRGHAYVAVSAQKAGLEGGAALGLGGTPLKKANPERYSGISHPGDAWSFDMFSQAGRILRGPDAPKVLGPLVARRVIAIGESQSAVYLTTYVNAVDPLAKVYDGFVIHSRFGSAAPLQGGSMGGAAGQPRAVKLRADVRVPVITVLTETDMLDSAIPGFHAARQPDHERLRIWEVAGTAHADNYTFTVGAMDSGTAPLEKLAAASAPTADVLGGKLAKPMNNAPQHHYVVHAALWHLDQWIRTRKAPPKAAPLKMTTRQGSGQAGGQPTQFVVNAHGIAEGGIRTPWVDVPITRLSGVPNSGSQLAFLVGVSEPFDAATLARLYPGGKREYLRKFEASLSSAITAGFILPADRKEILDLAALTYSGSR